MLDTLSPQQFAEWQAYYAVAPWGDDWQQAAVVAQQCHMAAGGKARPLEDFQPRVEFASADQSHSVELQQQMIAARYSAQAHANRRARRRGGA